VTEPNRSRSQQHRRERRGECHEDRLTGGKYGEVGPGKYGIKVKGLSFTLWCAKRSGTCKTVDHRPSGTWMPKGPVRPRRRRKQKDSVRCRWEKGSTGRPSDCSFYVTASQKKEGADDVPGRLDYRKVDGSTARWVFVGGWWCGGGFFFRGLCGGGWGIKKLARRSRGGGLGGEGVDENRPRGIAYQALPCPENIRSKEVSLQTGHGTYRPGSRGTCHGKVRIHQRAP